MGVIGLLRGDDVVVAASDCSGGVWIVPWISRRARPDGVLRRVGRGLFCCIWGVDRRWSGIEGMAKGLVQLVSIHIQTFLKVEVAEDQPCRLH